MDFGGFSMDFRPQEQNLSREVIKMLVLEAQTEL